MDYFDRWKSKIERLIEEHPVQIVSWEATRDCNLNCLHCGSPRETWNREQELSAEEVIRVFNDIAEQFDMFKFRHINITGGEPFVRRDLIDILKEISKKSCFRNIDIQTNGVILADKSELLNIVKQYGVTGIGVSIDGLKQTHERFRGCRDGSFEKSLRTAKLASQKGYVVTFSTVAHSENIGELPELFKLARDVVGARYFRVMKLDCIGRTNLNRNYLLSPEQMRQVVSFLHQQYVQDFQTYANPKSTMVELGCAGWLGRRLEGEVNPFFFHCIGGINNLGILYDGKISSCSNISRDFIQGDVRKDNLKDVWENRFKEFRSFDWKKKGDCKDCSEWQYCHGGPMHKRLKDGTMIDCSYKMIIEGKDYRKTLPDKAFTTVAGN
ncbi:radical SAM protein [Candidatus Pacearchaeota archaeon]|nr:radical SAM protein [Candidatus Pacearchaeota archaeon]